MTSASFAGIKTPDSSIHILPALPGILIWRNSFARRSNVSRTLRWSFPVNWHEFNHEKTIPASTFDDLSRKCWNLSVLSKEDHCHSPWQILCFTAGHDPFLLANNRSSHSLLPF